MRAPETMTRRRRLVVLVSVSTGGCICVSRLAWVSGQGGWHRARSANLLSAPNREAVGDRDPDVHKPEPAGDPSARVRWVLMPASHLQLHRCLLDLRWFAEVSRHRREIGRGDKRASADTIEQLDALRLEVERSREHDKQVDQLIAPLR